MNPTLLHLLAIAPLPTLSLAQSPTRGPCPVLNALANHALLPSTGTNITLPAIITALTTSLKVSTELATALGAAGQRLSSAPETGAFSLIDLARHNAIEHDGSLSRRDLGGDGRGDNVAFDAQVFGEFVRGMGFAGEEREGRVSVAMAARGRWSRIQCSKARNQNFTYSPPNRFNSYAELSTLLLLFRDPDDAVGRTSRLDWIRMLFEQERLPYSLGWSPVNPINGVSVANEVLAVAMATPEKDADLVVSSSGAGAGAEGGGEDMRTGVHGEGVAGFFVG